MYAMLTGNLPFTVEPFNIKSLYNKMMKNEMNAIPEHLSKSGEELLRKLLNPDPTKRISLKEAMEHAWLNEGYANPLKPFPYPNKPTEDQVNPTILRYMNSNMEFNVNEIAENIKSNKPSSSLATYYLLLNKVKTMLLKMEPKSKEKLKPRIESKPVVKELKQIKTIQPLPQQQANIVTTTPTTTTTAAAAVAANNQSPIPRKVSVNNNSNSATSGNQQNTFTLIRNKTDVPNKYSVTTNGNRASTDKTVSPIPTTTTSVYTHGTSGSTNGQTNNPASTFAGAIKNLTQKYKTMHLNTSIDANNLTGSLNTHLNGAGATNGNATYNLTLINNTSPNSNSISTSNSNNSFPYNKNNYMSGNSNATPTGLTNGNHNNTMSSSIDHSLTNNVNHNTSNSGCEGNSSNNSESISLSDDHTKNSKLPTRTSNNNLNNAPTLGKSIKN